jgi:hypothetical protein
MHMAVSARVIPVSISVRYSNYLDFQFQLLQLVILYVKKILYLRIKILSL